jgi:metal-dependent amidase/aminoacylase/carboxypeptidase family protein
MAHPTNYSQAYLTTAACLTNADVSFHGRKAHAGLAPWDGVNSLDAITLMWQAVGLLRQQLMPTDRISGVVVDGGAANNVCPDYSKGSFGLRAETVGRLAELKEKFVNCARGAATCTGCTCTVDVNGWLYADLRTNDVLGDRYAEHMVRLGRPFPDGKEEQKRRPFAVGTDQGNVSYVVPAIHPTYDIGCVEGCHTNEFYEAAGTERAFEECLLRAGGLACCAIDVLMDDEVYERMKEEFEELKKRVGDVPVM